MLVFCLFVSVFKVSSVLAQGSSCPQGWFGEGCKLQCHCLNECSRVGCEDYQCQSGYFGAPECQKTCPANRFGVNCKGECHCLPESPCRPTNGFCKCDPDWDGPSCQIRLPRLSEGPKVEVVAKGRIRVWWQGWNNDSDVGSFDLNITQYELQVSTSQTPLPSSHQWQVVTSTSRLESEYMVQAKDQKLYHTFRVLCYWDDSGKAQEGLPSPPSIPVALPCFAFEGCVTTQGSTASELVTTTTTSSSTLHTTVITKVSTLTSTISTVTSQASTIPLKVLLPPKGLTLKQSTESSLEVAWTLDPSSAAASSYQVSFISSNGDLQLQVSPSNATSFNITGLSPYTTYTIQVRSIRTFQDYSNLSELSEKVTFTTLDGKPGPPTDLRMTERNETCIKLQWKPPLASNGVIMKYHVALQPFTLLEQTFVLQNEVDNFLSPQFLLCQLRMSSQYLISITAETRTQKGESTSGLFYTEVGQPPPPPAPVVVTVSATTATLLLSPAVIGTGPVSMYYVVVQEATTAEPLKYNEMENLELTDDPTKKLNLAGYTAIEINPSGFTSRKTFLLGDNAVYGAFQNKALIEGIRYWFLYVLSSSLDGVTKMSYSQSEVVETKSITTINKGITSLKIFLDRTSLTEVTTKASLTASQNATTGFPESSDEWRVVLFVLLIFVPLFLALVCFLIWFYLKRSKQPKDSEDESKIAYKPFHTPFEAIKWTQKSNVDAKRFPIYKKDDERVKQVDKKCITIEEEFNQLPSAKLYFCATAKIAKNKEKNRFDHILPFDSSRVCLKRSNGDEGSDYINASYIFHNSQQKVYIAAQSPFNQQTICDFWSMVYEQNTSAVVMLSNVTQENTVKCEQYWPADSFARKYGRVTVVLEDTSTYSHYVVRKFVLTSEYNGNKRLKLRQYQFTACDFDDKALVLLEFWRMVTMDQRTRKNARPDLWVVHCSTGVSRTGVFIALDHTLNKWTSQQGVNVYRTCHNMRKYRPFMLKSLKHYKFIYDLLYEAMAVEWKEMFLDISNTVSVVDTLKRLDNSSSISLFKEQYNLCERMSVRPSVSSCSVALSDANKAKNRFNSEVLVAQDANRVHLYDTGNPNCHLYINASFIDTRFQRRHIIKTQDPLPATLCDFWRMVYETDCKCIVDMNPLDRPCDRYLPKDQERIVGDNYAIKIVRLDAFENYDRRTLTLSCLMYPVEEGRLVWHYDFKDWTSSKDAPSSRVGLLRLMNDIQDTTLFAKPIVVHCLNSASHTGLFCACMCIWMSVRRNESVDIFHLVRDLKDRSFQFVSSHVQYNYLFKFLWESLNLMDKK